MHPLYEAMYTRFAVLHESIKAAIKDLPPEGLDWQPGPEMNSLAVLVVHLTGAARYWVGDVAMQDSSDRDRAAEFRAAGLDEAALVRRLDETLAYIERALAGLTVADLNAVRTSPRDGKPYTVAWALVHALEHTALHTGHIEVTRQFLPGQFLPG